MENQRVGTRKCPRQCEISRVKGGKYCFSRPQLLYSIIDRIIRVYLFEWTTVMILETGSTIERIRGMIQKERKTINLYPIHKSAYARANVRVVLLSSFAAARYRSAFCSMARGNVIRSFWICMMVEDWPMVAIRSLFPMTVCSCSKNTPTH